MAATLTSRRRRALAATGFIFALGIAVSGLTALDAAGSARADWRQAAPWCANMGGGWGFDCSFQTYRQCMATARGLGGSCMPNPRAASGDDRRRRQRSDHWDD